MYANGCCSGPTPWLCALQECLQDPSFHGGLHSCLPCGGPAAAAAAADSATDGFARLVHGCLLRAELLAEVETLWDELAEELGY